MSFLGLDIDVIACLRMGAIGGLGAIPGTLCAHPCDVVKINMQIGGSSSYPKDIRSCACSLHVHHTISLSLKFRNYS